MLLTSVLARSVRARELASAAREQTRKHKIYGLELPPKIGQTPLVRWRRSKPVTQRQGGSGVHGKVDTKPFVWSVYYRLVRISLVWSDTTSYPTL